MTGIFFSQQILSLSATGRATEIPLNALSSPLSTYNFFFCIHVENIILNTAWKTKTKGINLA